MLSGAECLRKSCEAQLKAHGPGSWVEVAGGQGGGRVGGLEGWRWEAVADKMLVRGHNIRVSSCSSASLGRNAIPLVVVWGL